jgi:hypothetical protein
MSVNEWLGADISFSLSIRKCFAGETITSSRLERSPMLECIARLRKEGAHSIANLTFRLRRPDIGEIQRYTVFDVSLELQSEVVQMMR